MYKKSYFLALLVLISGCTAPWDFTYEGQHSFKLDYVRFIDSITPDLPKLFPFETHPGKEESPIRERIGVLLSGNMPGYGKGNITLDTTTERSGWKNILANLSLSGELKHDTTQIRLTHIDTDIASIALLRNAFRINTFDITGNLPLWIKGYLLSQKMELNQWYIADQGTRLLSFIFPEENTHTGVLDPYFGRIMTHLIADISTNGFSTLQDLLRNDVLFVPKTKGGTLMNDSYVYALDLSATGVTDLLDAAFQKYSGLIQTPGDIENAITHLGKRISGHATMRIHQTDSQKYSFIGMIHIDEEKYEINLESLPERVKLSIHNDIYAVTSLLDRGEDGRIKYSCVFEDDGKKLEFFRLVVDQGKESKLYSVFIGHDLANGAFLMYKKTPTEMVTQGEFHIPGMDIFKVRATMRGTEETPGHLTLQYTQNNTESVLYYNLDGGHAFSGILQSVLGSTYVHGNLDPDHLLFDFLGNTGRYKMIHDRGMQGDWQGGLSTPLGTVAWSGANMGSGSIALTALSNMTFGNGQLSLTKSGSGGQGIFSYHIDQRRALSGTIDFHIDSQLLSLTLLARDQDDNPVNFRTAVSYSTGEFLAPRIYGPDTESEK